MLRIVIIISLWIAMCTHMCYVCVSACLHLYDVWVCLCVCVWVSVYCVHLFDVCIAFRVMLNMHDKSGHPIASK